MKKCLMIFLVSTIVLCSYGQSSKENCECIQTPPYGMNNGYQWVDMGLSVKWASCNIGANSPEEIGDYYAWGETETKKCYSKDYYKYGKLNEENNLVLTKYCVLPNQEGFVDHQSVLTPEDDAARVVLGGTWRIPTVTEFRELKTLCKWTSCQINGVSGYEVQSLVNGNKIFLPTTGYMSYSTLKTKDISYSTLRTIGEISFYWSNEVYCNRYNDQCAVGLQIRYQKIAIDFLMRYYGATIRAVCP